MPRTSAAIATFSCSSLDTSACASAIWNETSLLFHDNKNCRVCSHYTLHYQTQTQSHEPSPPSLAAPRSGPASRCAAPPRSAAPPAAARAPPPAHAPPSASDERNELRTAKQSAQGTRTCRKTAFAWRSFASPYPPPSLSLHCVL